MSGHLVKGETIVNVKMEAAVSAGCSGIGFTTPKRGKRQSKPTTLNQDNSQDLFCTPKKKIGAVHSSLNKADDCYSPKINVKNPERKPASANKSARKTIDCYFRRTSTGKSRSSGTSTDSVGMPSKSTPSSPSPYKSHRPKFLPKNIELHKKKQQKRKADLERLNKVYVNLRQAINENYDSTARVKRPKDNYDPMGSFVPHQAVFAPQMYFVSFDESSLNPKDFVSADSLWRRMSTLEIFDRLMTGELLITSVKECRFCCYFLTVTRNRSLVDVLSPIILRKLADGTFYLGWSDVQKLLINFGLTTEVTVNSETTVSNNLERSPQKWNLVFFFILVNHSFVNYSLHYNKRLLTFLIDSLFEPILTSLHSTVISLLKRVLKHLLKKGLTISDLIPLLNRSYLSVVHNRFIFQYLASDATLCKIARVFALLTIHNLLKLSFNFEDDFSFEQLLTLLEGLEGVLGRTSVKEVYQLFLICEKMTLLPDSDPDDKNKLAGFSEKIHSNFPEKNSFYLNPTVYRLQANAPIND